MWSGIGPRSSSPGPRSSVCAAWIGRTRQGAFASPEPDDLDVPPDRLGKLGAEVDVLARRGQAGVGRPFDRVDAFDQIGVGHECQVADHVSGRAVAAGVGQELAGQLRVMAGRGVVERGQHLGHVRAGDAQLGGEERPVGAPIIGLRGLGLFDELELVELVEAFGFDTERGDHLVDQLVGLRARTEAGRAFVVGDHRDGHPAQDLT